MNPRSRRSSAVGQLLFPLLLGVVPLHAAEPAYYECYYPEVSNAAQWPPILRFMLDTARKRGFRIDSLSTRPVQIYLSGNEITLVDYQENKEVSLVTIRDDGASVLSRHLLSGPNDEAERQIPLTALGSQSFGRCSPSHESALRSPQGTGFE